MCVVFIFFSFFFSCSGEKLPNGVSVENNLLTEQEAKLLLKIQKPDNSISIDKAIGLFNEFADFFNKEKISNPNRMVNSISALVPNKTKSIISKSGKFGDVKIPDTLAYFISFGNNSGSAIVSADMRVDSPVLAFSESGSFSEQTDNPGFILFLERLEYYMLNSIVETERQKDTLLDGILKKINAKSNNDDILKKMNIEPDKVINPSLIYSAFGFENYIGPLISTKWGQEKPFSDSVGGQCTNTNNGKYLAGCVATAAAQIMNYWKHPSTNTIQNSQWYSIKWMFDSYITSENFYKGVTQVEKAVDKKARKEVAELFKLIGTSVRMDYGCSISNASVSFALYYLNSLGFNFAGNPTLNSYLKGIVKESLDYKRPLIAKGCVAAGCHAWIMDGSFEYAVIDSANGFTIRLYYVHNNWGWNGKDDDYFFSGVFDPLGETFQNIEVASVYK
jgi:hypothetical protein